MVEKNQKISAQELVLAALAAMFTDFDAEAAKGLLEPDCIQHFLAVPTGGDPVLGFISILEDSGIVVTTHRVITEGDIAVLPNRYEKAQAIGAETLVAFDVFRAENGQVASGHRDNLQMPPAQTVSGRSMADGLTDVTDLDLTEDNKVLV